MPEPSVTLKKQLVTQNMLKRSYTTQGWSWLT